MSARASLATCRSISLSRSTHLQRLKRPPSPHSGVPALECIPRGSDHGDRGGRSLARRIPLADCEKPVLFQVGKKARRRRRCSRRSTEMPHAAGKEKAAAGRQPEPRRKRKHRQCIRKLRACQAPLHKVWHRLQSMSAFGALRLYKLCQMRFGNHFLPDNDDGRAMLTALLRFGMTDDSAIRDAPWSVSELPTLKRRGKRFEVARRWQADQPDVR